MHARIRAPRDDGLHAASARIRRARVRVRPAPSCRAAATASRKTPIRRTGCLTRCACQECGASVDRSAAACWRVAGSFDSITSCSSVRAPDRSPSSMYSAASSSLLRAIVAICSGVNAGSGSVVARRQLELEVEAHRAESATRRDPRPRLRQPCPPRFRLRGGLADGDRFATGAAGRSGSATGCGSIGSGPIDGGCRGAACDAAVGSTSGCGVTGSAATVDEIDSSRRGGNPRSSEPSASIASRGNLGCGKRAQASVRRRFGGDAAGCGAACVGGFAWFCFAARASLRGGFASDLLRLALLCVGALAPARSPRHVLRLSSAASRARASALRPRAPAASRSAASALPLHVPPLHVLLLHVCASRAALRVPRFTLRASRAAASRAAASRAAASHAAASRAAASRAAACARRGFTLRRFPTPLASRAPLLAPRSRCRVPRFPCLRLRFQSSDRTQRRHEIAMSRRGRLRHERRRPRSRFAAPARPSPERACRLAPAGVGGEAFVVGRGVEGLRAAS